jgi:hypothetical protein
VLGLGDHHLDSDTFHIYASNATPSASADTVKGDLAEITAENDYPSGGSDVTNTWSESSGTGTMGATDVVWTANGGSFGPLRYVAIYNNTHASDSLMCWWDYGSAVTGADGETFTNDFTNICTIA